MALIQLSLSCSPSSTQSPSSVHSISKVYPVSPHRQPWLAGLSCWHLPSNSLHSGPRPPAVPPQAHLFGLLHATAPPLFLPPAGSHTTSPLILCPSPVCRLPHRTHCGRLPALPVPGTDVEGGQVKGQLSDPYDGNPIPPGEQGGAESGLSCNSLTRLSDQRGVPQAQETSPALSFQGQRHRKAFPESW